MAHTILVHYWEWTNGKIARPQIFCEWVSATWEDSVAVVPSIDEYLRERLMPVEGVIPHVQGIDMYGNSILVGTVGGDLFEYINFQQRYDIDARIQRALKLSKEYLEPLPAGTAVRNSVDDHVQWLQIEAGLPA